MIIVRRNRSSTEIIRDILEAATEGKGKTQIMYGCNLSYEQVTSYLAELIKRNMVEWAVNERGKDIYTITERGRECMEVMDHLRELLTGDNRQVFETYQNSRQSHGRLVSDGLFAP